jgi:hypothetical protein
MSTVPTMYCEACRSHIFPVVGEFDGDGNCDAECPRCGNPIHISIDDWIQFYDEKIEREECNGINTGTEE